MPRKRRTQQLDTGRNVGKTQSESEQLNTEHREDACARNATRQKLSRMPIGTGDLHKINPGDMIGWHCPDGTVEHAVVSEVNLHEGKVRVIHFKKSTGNATSSVITEEWIEI